MMVSFRKYQLALLITLLHLSGRGLGDCACSGSAHILLACQKLAYACRPKVLAEQSGASPSMTCPQPLCAASGLALTRARAGEERLVLTWLSLLSIIASQAGFGGAQLETQHLQGRGRWSSLIGKPAWSIEQVSGQQGMCIDSTKRGCLEVPSLLHRQKGNTLTPHRERSVFPFCTCFLCYL